MKVIKRGVLPSEKKYRGRCPHCESIVEATHDELTHTTCQFDGDYSVADCPVCEVSRIYFEEY